MIIGATAAWPDYELIDFGGGRKLERFGARLLDRPSPAAEGMQPRSSAQWEGAIRFERGDHGRENQWHGADLDMNPWTIACGQLTFELRLTPFGHVGLFPEQAENWQWLARVAAASKEPLKILNLFAYTGGSTLVAAAAGAEVTHVDSAANTIEWARKNAELSNLSQAPIRWIAEDALTFVGRELKRGNLYDAIILDPPSYGLGPKKEVWQLEKQLVQLLTLCVELTQRSPRFMLFSCHTPTVNAARAGRLLRESLDVASVAGRDMMIASTAAGSHGARLHSGVVARWTP